MRLFFLAFLIIPLSAVAQPEFQSTRFAENVGLSHNTVTNLKLDENGFLWIGTIDGLNRFDGKSVKIFRSKPNSESGLSSSFIHGFHQENDEEIWIGTRDGGINIFNLKTEEITQLQLKTSTGKDLNNETIQLIFSDQNKVTWISIPNGAFGNIDKKAGLYFPKVIIDDSSGEEISSPNALIEFKNGGLLASSLNGLYYISPKYLFRDEDRVVVNRLAINSTFPFPNADFMYVDDNGKIWVNIINEGLKAMDPNNYSQELLKSISSGVIESSLSESVVEKGEWLLTGGENGYITAIHKISERVEKVPFTDISVIKGKNKLHVDRKGNIWVRTWGDGVYFLKEKKGIRKFNNQTAKVDLPADFILGFEEDEKGIWIASFNGLAYQDKVNLSIQNVKGKIEGFGGNFIWSLQRDEEGLWVSTTDGGLNFIKLQNVESEVTQNLRAVNFNPENSIIKSNNVHQVFLDSRGWLYLGYEGEGLQIIQNTKGWMEGNSAKLIELGKDSGELNILSDKIRKIYEDKEGRVWLATMDNGVIRIEFENESINEIRNFSHSRTDENTIGYNDTRSILQENDSTFWFATYGGGITKWNEKTNEFTRITTEQGLANNSTYGILSEKEGNYIWVSTNSGLSRINTISKKIINYTESDGLQNLEFNTGAFKSLENGNLLFGGINGFNLITPNELEINDEALEVVLTSIKLFNDEIKSDTSSVYVKNLQLPYNQNFLSFDFAGLEYSSPEKIEYAYKMEGIDEEWVYSMNRNFASYPNLKPNKYTLKLKAANSVGIWNENETQLSITILPPWWQTIWFRGISAFILLSGFIYTTIYFSQRKLRQKIRSMEIENKLRNERERISRDLHDHVGSQLANIMSGLSLVEKYNETDNAQKSKVLTNSLRSDAELTIKQLRETIWALNQKELTLEGFENYLKTYFNSQSVIKEKLNIEYSVLGDKEHQLSATQALNIFRIFQEAMQNTLKYAGAEMVNIKIEEKTKELIFSIKDDGEFKSNKSDFNGGYGMGNMKKRAVELGAEIEIKTDNGTEVRLCVPK